MSLYELDWDGNDFITTLYFPSTSVPPKLQLLRMHRWSLRLGGSVTLYKPRNGG